jgi:uncharacterized membrane protein
LPKVITHNLILFIILVFAVFVRSINIDSYGLYGDEKYSIMVVNGISTEGATQPEIFKRDKTGAPIVKYFTPKQFWDALSFKDFDEAIIRTDNGNSSTFYAALYVWKSLFGQSDGALRWMGVLFDSLTILLLFLFCKNILNLPFVGLLAGFFAAIEPFMIAYTHQVRNYPLGIFLTFLSVYLFFRILKNEAINKVSYKFYFGYGLVILLGILCHFYVVLFVFCQFIALVISHLRNKGLLKRFVFTYVVSFTFLVLWFTIGSGRYTINTLKEKDIIFQNMLKSNGAKPNEISFVTAASFANIKAKLAPIVADNFLITNDIFAKINGWANLLCCVILAAIFIVLLDLSQSENSKKKQAIYLVLATIFSFGFYFLFSVNPLYYIYLAVVFVVLFIVIRHFVRYRKGDYGFLLFAFVSMVLPILITIVASVKAGHTANIYQKYLSFGLPIGFVLMAFGAHLIYKNKSYLAYVYLIVLVAYLTKIYQIDKEVLQDNYPKYTIHSKRKPNPYYLVANKLTNLYQKGDTIIYPNAGHTAFDQYDDQMKQDYVSVLDAQLTIIYLPKFASFIQRVEANEPNKIYLYQSKTNSKVLVFDFEGKKYRY